MNYKESYSVPFILLNHL